MDILRSIKEIVLNFRGSIRSIFSGNDISRKTLGVLGLGRIGSRVAYHAARGFDMKIIYYDVKRDEQFEKDFGAEFKATPEELLKEFNLSIPVLKLGISFPIPKNYRATAIG